MSSISRFFISGLSLLLLVWSCSVTKNNASSSKSNNKTYSRITPEPGTHLTRMATLVLHYGNDFVNHPDSLLNRYGEHWEAGGPHMGFILDTSVMSGSYRVPVRIYYPIRKSRCKGLPVLVFFHGGGFDWGNNKIYNRFNRKLSRSTQCIVVSAEYRLAPAYPYPAGVDDCYSTLEWVSDNLGYISSDSAKIAVIGDSAGGNLAAVMALMSRDKKGPAIACQILLYPATNFSDTLYASRKYFSGIDGPYYLINEAFLRKVKKQYLGNIGNESDPYISPMEAKLTSNLPPALIITAQVDPLRDEGRIYGEKLKKAGVNVEYKEYHGMIHGFISFYPFLLDGRRAFRQTSNFLEEYLK
jgi:acetyl esterase